jgi:hypothetical protein
MYSNNIRGCFKKDLKDFVGVMIAAPAKSEITLFRKSPYSMDYFVNALYTAFFITWLE